MTPILPGIRASKIAGAVHDPPFRDSSEAVSALAVNVDRVTDKRITRDLRVADRRRSIVDVFQLVT
jgi:hypothetical protein